MLDKKTFLIGVLSVSALVLLLVNFLAPRQAAATYETTYDTDYTMSTATAPRGGDVVFITEKRSGIMAAYTYDPNTKAMKLLDALPIQNVFAKMKR